MPTGLLSHLPDPFRDALRARFFRMANALESRPVRIVEEEPPPPPSTEQVLALNLGAWTKQEACSKTFIPFLEAEAEAADKAETATLGAAYGYYHKGRRDAVKDLLARFRAWQAGHAFGEAPAEEK